MCCDIKDKPRTKDYQIFKNANKVHSLLKKSRAAISRPDYKALKKLSLNNKETCYGDMLVDQKQHLMLKWTLYTRVTDMV